MDTHTTRKQDLIDKFQVLQRKSDNSVELVKLLLKSCDRFVGEVCDDDVCMSHLRYLDERLTHILQFNSRTDNFISQGFESFESGDAPRPRSRPCLVNEVRKVDSPQTHRSRGRLLPEEKAAKSQLHDVPPPRPRPTRRESDHGSLLSEQPSSRADVLPPQEKVLPVLQRTDQNHVRHFPETSEENLVKQVLRPAAVSITGADQAAPQNVGRHFPHASEENQVMKVVGSPAVSSTGNKVQKPLPSLNGEIPKHPTSVSKSSLNSTSNSTTKSIDGYPKSVCRPLNVGDECAVMLSHIETPGEFYVHIACTENTNFDSFEEDINEFYIGNKVTFKSKSIAKKRMGNFCVCFQPDIGWCRAQVLDWCMDEEHIEVQLVDYGDIYYVCLSLVQPILPKFLQQPLYATRCHLAFIQPPSPNKEWPPESAKVFNCYMPMTTKIDSFHAVIQEPDVPIVYSIMKAEKDDKICTPCVENQLIHHTSLSVILGDVSDPHKLTMNDNLVDLGYADALTIAETIDLPVSSPSQGAMPKDKNNIVISDRMRDVENWVLNSHVPQPRPLVNDPQPRPLVKAETPSAIKSNKSCAQTSDGIQDWNPMRDDYLNAAQSGEDVVLAVSGYSPQDEKRVCPFYAKNKRCFKGNNCRMEHSFAHHDGYTTDKELIYTCAYNSLQMPDEDSVIVIIVTHVPIRKPYFYCIIPSDMQNSRFEYEGETLTTLHNHINEPKLVRTFCELQIPPALGQIVLALSKSDSLWHRAQVVQELDDGDGTIGVLFVDNGLTEVIHESKVRAIQPSMLHLPFQAIECHLANVEISNLLKASEHFKALCLGKSFNAKIVKSFEGLQIVHCLLGDASSRDVGLSLIEAGLGFNKDWTF